jgi:hypothetical protein
VIRAALAPLAASVVAASLAACGHGDARFPRRPDGCDVRLFHDSPDGPTENIGPVQVRCADEIPAADCLRTLEDTVCALGGDVVWGVGDPEHENGKVHYYGRAAHTKAPRAKRPGSP